MEPILFAALGAAAGVLIGCVGIGGVILVPAPVYLAGQPLPVAIAAALGAFIASGLVGVHEYSKADSIRWRETAWTWGGALPFAFAGALLVTEVAPWLLELVIAVLAAASGLNVFVRRGAWPGASVVSVRAHGVVLAVGTWLGAKAAHALPTARLRKAVPVLLILVGGLVLLRVATS